MAEVINISSNSAEEIKLSSPSTPKNELPARSVDLGPGVELLMNEKKKTSGGGGDTEHLDSLKDLEFELNNLTDDGDAKKNKGDVSDSLFNSMPSIKTATVDKKDPFTVKFEKHDHDTKEVKDDIGIGLGKSSVASEKNNNKTWDGYSKFNDIPIDPTVKPVDAAPKLSKEEMVRKKFEMLRKLESLEKKGVKLSKRYSMESSLLEMEGEYEMIMSEKKKRNSIKFQGKMLLACVTGLEFLNNKIDPFDLKLDGWGDQVTENLDDYDEIFGELHEKYKSKAKMAPELKLLFQLGGSAIMLHMTNSMFQTSMPGIDDIMRQNPDLMRNFTQAAASSMSSSHPGFSGFMNNMMSQESNIGGSMTDTGGGINIQETYEDAGVNTVEKSVKRERESEMRNINFGAERTDMKGPSDIDGILSNLKKTSGGNKNDDKDSTISISELKEIQGSLNNGSMPSKSKKRNSSKKTNVIELDL
tara:strand:- start:324 stop:1739 length:1416 start_codon:yes stop_codon:yes gene_type:complete